MRAYAQIARLALLDMIAEWRVALCLIIALAAGVTPMLVLFGLKFGLIETMRERLLQNPRTLEIRPLGSGQFDQDWFARMAAREDVSFVLPRTRSIATSVILTAPGAGRGSFERIELVPTAVGDPLLEGPPPGEGEAVLSASAARALDLAPGDQAAIDIGRQRDGRRETASAAIDVLAILPESAFSRPAAFVPLSLLGDVERFRDGFAVAGFGAEGETPPEGTRSYASFRLFARDLEAIPVLRDLLEAEGHDIRTRAGEIEGVQAMDRNLSAAFWLIATVALAGLTLSLAASLWANVESKTGALAVLRLIGFPSAPLAALPVVQALVLSTAGMLLAGLLYLGIAALLNARFADSLAEGQLVCRLELQHFLLGFAALLTLGLLASVIGGVRAARIEPGERLRDV
ncbi:MAG: FtsX-like permease family protein [Pseudomonadota bacterium]